jgi:hypothetical protein
LLIAHPFVTGDEQLESGFFCCADQFAIQQLRPARSNAVSASWPANVYLSCTGTL